MQSNQDELFPSFVEEEHYNPKTAEIIEKEICIKTFENLLSENEQNKQTHSANNRQNSFGGKL